MHNEKCLSRHLGVWAMADYGLERWPLWYSALQAIRAGRPLPETTAARARSRGGNTDDYEVVNGAAIISISGPMMKGDSKFGGANTVAIRQALRSAASNDAVKSVLLYVDSPGGTVAGTDELAREVKRTAAYKPVHAHIDDLGASAAYWVASQAQSITAGMTSEIGSIGVYTVVEDSSEAAAAAGIKVHVVSTGPYKGALEPGTEVTKKQLDYVRDRVDDMNKHFYSAVLRGRGDRISGEQLRKASDGRVFGASEAKALGLIDRIQTFDEALGTAAPRRIAAALALRRARLQSMANS